MTRMAFVVLAACVLVAGCGDDDDGTTAPSNLPVVFTAQLSPANEVPPVGNAEGGGRGAVQITFQTAGDGSATATFHFQLSGFPSDTRVVGAHIHPGAAGVNGGVIVNTGVSAASTPTTTETGMSVFDITGINVSAATAQSIINNPGGHYFNVHSPLNPGGFVRGQLVRIQ
jgi:hypothetical protein